MITFEQALSALYKWSKVYSKDSRFDRWELINEAWLTGTIQKLTDIKHVSFRAKNNMIDYMRDQTQTRQRQRDERDNTQNPMAMIFTNALHIEDEEGHVFDITRAKEYPNKSEQNDFFKWVTEGLSRERTLVIKLRFLEDYTMKEMGKIIGISESRISQILGETILLIQKKVSVSDLGVRICKRKIYTAKRDQTRYYREYYDRKKGQIQERRRRVGQWQIKKTG